MPWPAERYCRGSGRRPTSFQYAFPILSVPESFPRDPKVAEKYAASFANVRLLTIDQAFGGWTAAQKTHFADGGTFDQIYRPGGR